jgi:hypothetical protein
MTLYTDNSNGGVDIDLDPADGKTKWLLENGYLGIKSPKKADEDRGRYATSEPAKNDPTLAANREAPVPNDKLKPHVANGGDEDQQGETTLGKDRGLEAPLVGNLDQAPKAKFKSNPDAGKIPAVDTTTEDTSLKAAIDKEQGQPKPLQPKETAPEKSDLKVAIDKGTEDVTTGSPA